jgi:hypothetical protein
MVQAHHNFQISYAILGIMFDDNQGWTSQITGQGGIIPLLNSRLFLVKRLHNTISKNRLKRIGILTK